MSASSWYELSLDLKFAVIVPVYNTANYLRECLESVLSQTYRNFILFAVDDGSIDESGKILDEYARKDSRLCVIHKNNGGVSIARNVALELIEAENDFDFIVCLDSDDYWSPVCLETIARTAIETGADVVAFGYEEFNRKGTVVYPKERKHDPIVVSKDEAFCLFSFANVKRMPFKNRALAAILDKSPARSGFITNFAFRALPVRGLRFDPALIVAEDQDYRVRGLMLCNNCVVISDCLYNYRLRSGSLSHSNKDTQSYLLLCLSWLKNMDNLPTFGRIVIEQNVFKVW